MRGLAAVDDDDDVAAMDDDGALLHMRLNACCHGGKRGALATVLAAPQTWSRCILRSDDARLHPPNRHRADFFWSATSAASSVTSQTLQIARCPTISKIGRPRGTAFPADGKADMLPPRTATATPRLMCLAIHVLLASSASAGKTLEELVAEEEHFEGEDLVEHLLDQDDTQSGNVNYHDHNGATALIHAAGIGSKPAIKILLAKGANIAARDVHGMTALHRAAEGGHLEVCKLLLANGAKRDATDIANVRAAELAHQWGHPKVAELLGHPSPWTATKTSANRPPPFNADGTEEAEHPRYMREL